MAGFIPAIHVFLFYRKQDADARNKCGHDDVEKARFSLGCLRLAGGTP
jgi:hypothetical protein